MGFKKLACKALDHEPKDGICIDSKYCQRVAQFGQACCAAGRRKGQIEGLEYAVQYLAGFHDKQCQPNRGECSCWTETIQNHFQQKIAAIELLVAYPPTKGKKTMNIKQIIYQTLELKGAEHYIPKNHNPSSASFKYSDGRVIGKDLLSLYLKWTGVKPSNPSDGSALLRMRLGDGAHIVVAQILAKAGIKAMSEVAAQSSVPGLKNKISYRVDGLHEIAGNLEVLEIKSSTDQPMFGKGWGIDSKGPKEDHLLQVICYLNLVPGVRGARLLYISRDTGRMLEYHILKDKDTYTCDGVPIRELSFAGITKRWALLEECLVTQNIPSPDYKAWLNEHGEIMDVKQIKGVKYKTDWQVLYDPYMDYIWKNPDNFKHTYNAEFKKKGLI